MSTGVVSAMCRLTVISPAARVDLAVPATMPVVELLSLVVSGLGPDVADRGVAEGGWVLQRATEPALDPASSVAGAGLRDGDVLHLRTRATWLPEMVFDDAVEVVAHGVTTRTPRWTHEHTRRCAVALAGGPLAVTLIACLLAGPPWKTSAVASGVMAIVSVLAARMARTYRRREPALAAGALAVANAFVCGVTSLGGQRAPAHVGAPQLLLGSGSAALTGVLVLLAVSDGVTAFTTVITAGVLSAIGTAVASGTPLGAASTATVVAVAALAVSPGLPALALRLSRLPLPTIPADAGDLPGEDGAVDGTHILTRTRQADQVLSGLVAGVAFAFAGAAALIAGRGVDGDVLSAVIGVICLLRARLFTGRTQRASLLAAGTVALLAAAVAGAAHAHGTTWLLAYAVPADVAALALLGLAAVLPGRRHSPGVSRAADVLEALLVLAVIPLALAVLGVYGSIGHSIAS